MIYSAASCALNISLIFLCYSFLNADREFNDMIFAAQIDKGMNLVWSYLNPVIVSPLTRVAKAIYLLQARVHFSQGFNQIFRVPSFLKMAEQTHDLILTSLKSNVLHYIIPYVMYRRGINVLLLKSPDIVDPMIITADWVITISFVFRLFVRQLVNNACYTVALPRVVANDVAMYLPRLLAETLAKKFSEACKVIFLSHVKSTPHDFYYLPLADGLQRLFSDFFSQPEITEKSIHAIIHPLSHLMYHFIKRENGLSVSDEFVENFSSSIAKVTAHELARGLIAAFNRTLNDDKQYLENQFNQVFVEVRSKALATHLTDSLYLVHQEAKSFFPLIHNKTCGCSIKKTMHASISSPIYYAGNLFFIALPDLINHIVMISPPAYKISKLVAYLMKIVIYGQNLNEFKVTTEGQCTRHRYLVFARNKAHSFGVGLAQLLGIEVLSFLLYVVTEVDTFLTRDAISNLVIQFASVAALAFNDPLPGNKKNPWDIFYLPKQMTRKALYFFNWLFLPEMEDTNAFNRRLKKAESILSNKRTNQLVQFLFCEGDFYPTPQQGQCLDGWVMASRLPAVKKVLTLFNKEIHQAVVTAEWFHHHAKWLTGPLLVLPVPGAIASMIVIPLRLLREDVLLNLIKKIQHILLDLRVVSEDQPVIQVNGNEQALLEQHIAEALAGTVMSDDIKPEYPPSVPVIHQKIQLPQEEKIDDFCLVEEMAKHYPIKKYSASSHASFFKSLKKSLSHAWVSADKAISRDYELRSFR